MDNAATDAARHRVADEATVALLIFELDGHRYGIAAAAVRELHRAATVIPLPKAPPIVEGILDIHGAVVPVLDLRARFGLPHKPAEPNDHLVVAHAGARVVAIRVDRAVDVVRVPAAEIEAPERVGTGIEYVAGIARLREGLVVIHDLATFLSRSESEELSSALEAPNR